MHAAIHQVQVFPIGEHGGQVHLRVQLGGALVQVFGIKAVVLDAHGMWVAVRGDVVGRVHVESGLSGRVGDVHGHKAQVFHHFTPA